MVATGVTFGLVPITWSPYSEGTPVSRSAVISKEISIASRGTKIEQPVPPAASDSAEANKPIYYPMGIQGDVVKMTAYIKGPTNYALWKPVVQGNLLYVSSSEYEELPVASYWWVETNTISRKGGMAAASNTGTLVGLWNHELSIIRSYRKGDQTVR